MEGYEQHTVFVNGINMHYAAKGTTLGRVLLFLHGFPSIWYSWRYQMDELALRGYRCIAPDLRGFGETDAPPSCTSYTVFHIVGDLVALLDSLKVDKAYVVGHDWGAFVAYHLCLFRPDRVRALVALSMVYRPFQFEDTPVEHLRKIYGDEYYICKFQEPGEAEADFATVGAALTMKLFLTYHEPGPLMISRERLAEFSHKPIPLPTWLTEGDLDYFARIYARSGFTGGLNYFRAIDLNWNLTVAWRGAKLTVPTKFVIGDKDMAYYMPGVKDYIHKGGFKEDLPMLKEVSVIEGAGHCINQESAGAVVSAIYYFFQIN